MIYWPSRPIPLLSPRNMERQLICPHRPEEARWTLSCHISGLLLSDRKGFQRRFTSLKQLLSIIHDQSSIVTAQSYRILSYYTAAFPFLSFPFPPHLPPFLSPHNCAPAPIGKPSRFASAAVPILTSLLPSLPLSLVVCTLAAGLQILPGV